MKLFYCISRVRPILFLPNGEIAATLFKQRR